MAKTSAKYWKDRAARDAEVFGKIDGEDGILKREKDAVRRQEAIYKRAQEQLDKELAELEKDVGKEAITIAAMQKPLTPKQLQDWSKRQEQRLDELIAQYGDKEGRKKFGLENAKTAKQDRANRIVRRNEALKQSIQAITSVAACESEKAINEQLKKETVQGEKDFRKQFPADFKADFNKVDSKTVENITRAVWKGDDFSDRVWANKHDMAKQLENTIALGVTNGWSVPRMAKEMERYVQSGKHSAERIVRTEINRVSNAIELESYKANSIKYYRFIATEDARVCEICGGYNNKVFAVDEAASGVNFPPMHPNCRCRTVLSTEDENGNEDDSWLDDMQAEVDEMLSELNDDNYESIDEISEKLETEAENLKDYTVKSIQNMTRMNPEQFYGYDYDEIAEKYGELCKKWKKDENIEQDYRQFLSEQMFDEVADGALMSWNEELRRIIPPPVILPTDANCNASFNPATRVITMPESSFDSPISTITHEDGHRIHFSLIDNDDVINKGNECRAKIDSGERDITIFGKKYRRNELYETSGNIETTMDRVSAVMWFAGANGKRELDYTDAAQAAFHAFDTYQSAVDTLITGHSVRYANNHDGDYTEAIANINSFQAMRINVFGESLKELDNLVEENRHQPRISPEDTINKIRSNIDSKLKEEFKGKLPSPKSLPNNQSMEFVIRRAKQIEVAIKDIFKQSKASGKQIPEIPDEIVKKWNLNSNKYDEPVKKFDAIKLTRAIGKIESYKEASKLLKSENPDIMELSYHALRAIGVRRETDDRGYKLGEVTKLVQNLSDENTFDKFNDWLNDAYEATMKD